MDAERYALVKLVFREAIRWVPAERGAAVEALVEALAAGDAAVAAEVRSLLAHHAEAAAEGAAAGEGLLAALAAKAEPGGWQLERVLREVGPLAERLADEPRAEDPPARLDAAIAARAAPEQLVPALGPIGPWTDVYALALACVELLRGGPVTEGGAAAALSRARDGAAPPTPRAVGLSVPDPVEAVLARALAVRPMERYQDVRRFWSALGEAHAAASRAPVIFEATRRGISASSTLSSPSLSHDRPLRGAVLIAVLMFAALAVTTLALALTR